MKQFKKFKEFKPEVFEKDVYLFDIQRTIKWNMLERRGPTFGEFARVDNPPVGSTIYYYLKQPAKSVKIVIKDLEGNEIQDFNGMTGNGIQRIFWDLRKRAAQQEGQQFRMRFAPTVDPGEFNVTLVVDGKEVVNKRLLVVQDPMLEEMR